MLGPHRALVSTLLGRLEHRPEESAALFDAAARALVQAFRRLPGDGPPERRATDLATDTMERAQRLNPMMAAAVEARVRHAVVGVGPAAADLDLGRTQLVVAAVMWAAVYGGHPNPLGPVIDLAERGGLAVVDAGGMVVLREKGLALVYLEGSDPPGLSL